MPDSRSIRGTAALNQIRVELIYDADCPNAAATRSLLISAFARTGASARWREWERSAPDTPAHARTYGSPTILVDGKDVAGPSPEADSAACRVYSAPGGVLARTPPLETICSALRASPGATKGQGRLRALIASFPAIGTALLPKLTCPLCWPAYTAALSALGLGFVDYTPYLLPATIGFLAIATGALAVGARRTGRILPPGLGLTASGVVLVGKFLVDSDWVTNGGIALLMGAVFLAARTRRVQPVSCAKCVGEGSEFEVQTH